MATRKISPTEPFTVALPEAKPAPIHPPLLLAAPPTDDVAEITRRATTMTCVLTQILDRHPQPHEFAGQ